MQECDGSTPPPAPTTHKYTRCIQPFVDGASRQPWHRCVAHTVRGNDCDALDSTRILQRSGGFNSRTAIVISERGASRPIHSHGIRASEFTPKTRLLNRAWDRYGDPVALPLAPAAHRRMDSTGRSVQQRKRGIGEPAKQRALSQQNWEPGRGQGRGERVTGRRMQCEWMRARTPKAVAWGG